VRTYKVRVTPDDPRCSGEVRYEVRAESADEAKAKALAKAPRTSLEQGVVIHNAAEIIDVEPDCCPTCLGLGVVPEGKGIAPELARVFKERFRRG
jgi:hypothetical protein